MRRVMLCFLLLVGCGVSHYGDFFPYYDDGTSKPKVVFLPVVYLTSEDQPLAIHLDNTLRWMAMDRGDLFLYSPEEVQNVLEQNKNIDQNNILKLADCFHPADFVLEAEVVQDSICSYSSDLNNCFIPLLSSRYRIARVVKLCIRVIDIRSETPKTIHYEVLEQSQAIVRDERLDNATSVYKQLAEQAICRIEEVIWSAKYTQVNTKVGFTALRKTRD